MSEIPWNWAKKREDEYAEYLGEMGKEMAEMMKEEERK